MSQEFYSIVTNAGAAAEINCLQAGTAIDFKYLAIGDSGGNYYEPEKTQTALINEKWRGEVTEINIDAAGRLYAAVAVPFDEGGFYIRESGVFNTAGELLLIAKMAETYKPTTSQGQPKDIKIKFLLDLIDPAVIEIMIDPSVINASVDYVDNAVSINMDQHDIDPFAHSALFTAKADKNGSNAEVFAVAEANAPEHAVRLEQLAKAVPTGTVFWFAADTAPTGYLKCNGAAISRSTYADLFAVTSTTFGSGDGSTTFNIPDLRAEFIRGWDDSRGVDSGRVFGSSQADELKSHTHTINNVMSPGAAYNDIHDASGNPTSPQTLTSNATGGTETRPRNVAFLPCIKY